MQEKESIMVIHGQLKSRAVARSDLRPTGMRTIAGSIPTSDKHILWRFGHEQISTTILSLPLIQDGQLSVTCERICTKYG